MILPVEVDIFGIMEENAYFYIDDETRPARKPTNF